MIMFVIDRHKLRATGGQVVEIWWRGRFVASLYGLEDECGVKLVSNYLPSLSHPFLLLPAKDFPPALEVRFDLGAAK